LSKARIGLGKQGEEAAVSFLQKQGYQIVSRNHRSRFGEIDIICRDRNSCVFVEVKTRQGTAYGAPVEAVTRQKQQKICRVALDYLTKTGLQDDPVRFDVIGVLITEGKTEITHVVNAFEAV